MTETQANTLSVPFRIKRSIYPLDRKVGNLWAVAWNTTIIIGGGYKQNRFGEDPSVVYYHRLGEWIRQETSGDFPPAMDNIAEVLNDKIILFDTYYGDMYSLSLETWIWTLLRPSGTKPALRTYGMASWIHHGKMYCFGGGVGAVPHHYSNELFCYDPSENSWEGKAQSGDIPSPRRNCCATTINDETVFLFGGSSEGLYTWDSLNDLYMLDMKSLQWTKIHGSVAQPIGQSVMPPQQSYTTLTSISQSAAVVFSSIVRADDPDECWLLDLDMAKQLEAPSRIWRQIPNHFKKFGYAAVREPLSRSIWLIGGFDSHAPADTLKISANKFSDLFFAIYL